MMIRISTMELISGDSIISIREDVEERAVDKEGDDLFVSKGEDSSFM